MAALQGCTGIDAVQYVGARVPVRGVRGVAPGAGGQLGGHVLHHRVGEAGEMGGTCIGGALCCGARSVVLILAARYIELAHLRDRTQARGDCRTSRSQKEAAEQNAPQHDGWSWSVCRINAHVCTVAGAWDAVSPARTGGGLAEAIHDPHIL